MTDWRAECEHMEREVAREAQMATRAMRERDEARHAARELFDLLTRLPENYSSRMTALRRKNPWLQADWEDGSDEAAPVPEEQP